MCYKYRIILIHLKMNNVYMLKYKYLLWFLHIFSLDFERLRDVYVIIFYVNYRLYVIYA